MNSENEKTKPVQSPSSTSPLSFALWALLTVAVVGAFVYIYKYVFMPSPTQVFAEPPYAPNPSRSSSLATIQSMSSLAEDELFDI